MVKYILTRKGKRVPEKEYVESVRKGREEQAKQPTSIETYRGGISRAREQAAKVTVEPKPTPTKKPVQVIQPKETFVQKRAKEIVESKIKAQREQQVIAQQSTSVLYPTREERTEIAFDPETGETTKRVKQFFRPTYSSGYISFEEPTTATKGAQAGVALTKPLPVSKYQKVEREVSQVLFGRKGTTKIEQLEMQAPRRIKQLKETIKTTKGFKKATAQYALFAEEKLYPITYGVAEEVRERPVYYGALTAGAYLTGVAAPAVKYIAPLAKVPVFKEFAIAGKVAVKAAPLAYGTVKGFQFAQAPTIKGKSKVITSGVLETTAVVGGFKAGVTTRKVGVKELTKFKLKQEMTFPRTQKIYTGETFKGKPTYKYGKPETFKYTPKKYVGQLEHTFKKGMGKQPLKIVDVKPEKLGYDIGVLGKERQLALAPGGKKPTAPMLQPTGKYKPSFQDIKIKYAAASKTQTKLSTKFSDYVLHVKKIKGRGFTMHTDPDWSKIFPDKFVSTKPSVPKDFQLKFKPFKPKQLKTDIKLVGYDKPVKQVSKFEKLLISKKAQIQIVKQPSQFYAKPQVDKWKPKLDVRGSTVKPKLSPGMRTLFIPTFVTSEKTFQLGKIADVQVSRPKTMLKMKPKLSPGMKLDIITKPKVRTRARTKVRTKQALKQVTIQQLKTEQVTELIEKTIPKKPKKPIFDPGFPSTPPTITTPPPPLIFKLPAGKPIKFKVPKVKSLASTYKPSLYGIELYKGYGKTIKKAPKITAGVGLRLVVKPKKGKKRRKSIWEVV